MFVEWISTLLVVAENLLLLSQSQLKSLNHMHVIRLGIWKLFALIGTQPRIMSDGFYLIYWGHMVHFYHITLHYITLHYI